jgi:chromate transporter
VVETVGRDTSDGHGVPFAEAFRFWLKLGFISFGGPAGQIAIMHRELVERRRWVGEARFLHALNYCMLLPGPEAQQLATYLGWLLHRTPGGLVAGGLFVLPSVFLLLILSYLYAAFGTLPLVAGALAGFKPVVVAIVIEAVLKIGGRALKRAVHYWIAGLAFLLMAVAGVPFPLVVFGAGLLGLFGSRFFPKFFAPVDSKTTEKKPESDNASGGLVENRGGGDLRRAGISDDAPPPEHTRPNFARSVRVAAVGFILWILPLVGLVLWFGWNSLPVGEYRFFSLAALVTFGGAYSVLAYVTQAAVAGYGWLTHAQAVDGLALAETTPGPLIMVLQFIGFMAGWNHPVAGLNQVSSALLCGLVTTYVTFLPSFVFIFLGAPFIEALRGNRFLTGALSGVTAAVVGVVLNLALVFGKAVFFPAGWTVFLNVPALLAAGMAFLALYRWKVDVLWVVLAGGLLGILGRAFGFGF